MASARGRNSRRSAALCSTIASNCLLPRWHWPSLPPQWLKLARAHRAAGTGDVRVRSDRHRGRCFGAAGRLHLLRRHADRPVALPGLGDGPGSLRGRHARDGWHWPPCFVCTVVAFGETGRLAVMGRWSPESQQPDRVFAQLREAIPPGQSVAATITHWLAFQGRNPWREVLFAACDPREVSRCQWLVLPVRRRATGLHRPLRTRRPRAFRQPAAAELRLFALASPGHERHRPRGSPESSLCTSQSSPVSKKTKRAAPIARSCPPVNSSNPNATRADLRASLRLRPIRGAAAPRRTRWQRRQPDSGH